MKTTSTNANALREQGIGGVTEDTKSASHLTKLTQSVKEDILPENGEYETSVITFTHVTSNFPKRVSKVYGLQPDGSLRKGRTSANISDARLQILSVQDMEAFATVLTNLESTNCLIYGIPAKGQERLLTKKKWREHGEPESVVPRSADAFVWPKGAGVLMLDYDAPKDGSKGLTKDEMLAVLNTAMTEQLAMVDQIWWPSTSSCLWHGDRELAGVKGQRLYIPVKDATDIPRAGKVLSERLWALGYGRIEISESGQCLERTIVDSKVWQTNRIDFAGGAICEDGLEQHRGQPTVIGGVIGGGHFLDTTEALPELSDDEEKKVVLAKSLARAEAKGLSDAAKEKWIVKRTEELIKRTGLDPENIEVTSVASGIARRAVEDRELGGDWLLQLEGGSQVTVIDVLNAPEKYHGVRTYDPLEPGYDGNRLVGKLYLIGGRPNLHSFAHGGVSFRLRRALTRVRVAQGTAHEATLATITVMRNSRDFYNYDTTLVSPSVEGKLKLHNADSLFHALGGITQYFYEKINSKTQEIEVHLSDPPLSVVKSVLSMDDSRDLLPLVATITLPTLRLDGSLLNRPGYDEETKLLFMPKGDVPHINLNPGLDEAKLALKYLWEPFKDFPFVDGIDRAAHLAALFSAVVRPAIPTCPAFGYDAPTQGSGKTLLARCVGILATGSDPAIYAPTDVDEEIRKRLTAILLEGQGAFVWDNVIGQFDSAAISAFLTGVKSADRILGVSKNVSLPNRSLMLVTGNNLSPVGDMARRIISARIDPVSATPFRRAFEMAPDKYCMANRLSMAAAALTIIRYHFGSCGGARMGDGNTASFEDWDRLVRQPVLRVHAELWPNYFGDVADLFSASMANDPAREALEQLLQSIADLVGVGQDVTAADLHGAANREKYMFSAGPTNTPAERFWEALHELSPRKSLSDWTVKSLGRVLHYRNGAVAGKLRLVERKGKDRNLFCIERLP